MAKVALEAIKEQKTSVELASQYQVHPGQIRKWKTVVTKGLVDLFSDKRKGKEQDRDKLLLIDKTNREISISHQAELLDISRPAFTVNRW